MLVQTRVGELELRIPQTRDSQFYPAVLEKGLRCERALRLALAEAYVLGVSTRKMAKLTEELCGLNLSSMQVSHAAATLDEDLARWRAFLQELVARGLHGVQLIASDAHEGLKAARKAVFGAVPWQRCQFHLQQNARAYVPRQEQKAAVAAESRAVYQAPNASEAERLLHQFVERYRSTAPRLAAWAEENVPEGLTVLSLPTAHQRRMRTTNPLARVNRELDRRTRVATLFPNERACERLISAALMEISEEWRTGKIYLTHRQCSLGPCAATDAKRFPGASRAGACLHRHWGATPRMDSRPPPSRGQAPRE